MKTKAHIFPDLNMASILEPANPDDANYTGTKVIVTVGPSCQPVDILEQLLESGMSVARLDLTWGPLEYHKKSLDHLQAAMKKTRKLCATMLDTLGRELMIRRPYFLGEDGYPWQVGNEISVKSGQRITITTRSDAEASDKILPIAYPGFCNMAEVGDYVYIGRYLVCGADSASLYLQVSEVTETEVVCEALNDAVLDGLLIVFHVERSSDTVSNVQNDLPLLSDYDKACMEALGQEYEIDFISLSYTRSGEDVLEARKFLDSVGMKATKIFAKVETRQALLNFKGILNAADGIIISRGNLGLDCEPEKMALIQKSLMQFCNLVGKPVLITRVVDTMVNTPRPTRAEATDVANAVLDSVDGIILGAETLRGLYPVESVKTIVSICSQAEQAFDHHYHFDHLMETAIEADTPGTPRPEEGAITPESGVSPGSSCDDLTKAAENSGHVRKSKLASQSYSSLNMAIHAMRRYGVGSDSNLYRNGNSSVPRSQYLSKLESIASAAVRAADKVQACLIVVYTHSGKTSNLVAKYRPPMPILTLVVPRLVSDSLSWKLEGRSNARQCLCTRGVLPVLAAPRAGGDAVLEEALAMATKMGLVKSHGRVVAVQRIHEDFCVKIVNVADFKVNGHITTNGYSVDCRVGTAALE